MADESLGDIMSLDLLYTIFVAELAFLHSPGSRHSDVTVHFEGVLCISHTYMEILWTMLSRHIFLYHYISKDLCVRAIKLYWNGLGTAKPIEHCDQ